jgi:hypothetical protein
MLGFSLLYVLILMTMNLLHWKLFIFKLKFIHLFVEVLDQYFGNVCELDIVFNFHKVINI